MVPWPLSRHPQSRDGLYALASRGHTHGGGEGGEATRERERCRLASRASFPVLSLWPNVCRDLFVFAERNKPCPGLNG